MIKFRANIFSIATTLNYFWSSVVGVVKVDYFDFSCKKFEKLKYGFCKKSPGIKVKKKVFNWAEVHLSKVTSYKIHILV